MYIAKARVEQAQLDKAIDEIKRTLGPDVVNVRYSLEEDWSGDDAIFFRIILSERASRRDQLHASTSQISNAIVQQLQPLERWGVLPYFDFRSQAEQTVLQDKDWD